MIDTEKPESSSQSEMYSGSDSSARATKYPFYVTLETSDGLMLGQHVYIEPGTGVNTEGLHLMTAYIVDADGKEPYVWVANKKDRLEKRNVKLGAYDEEQDTWEITEGLKETDYIAGRMENVKKEQPFRRTKMYRQEAWKRGNKG